MKRFIKWLMSKTPAERGQSWGWSRNSAPPFSAVQEVAGKSSETKATRQPQITMPPNYS